MNKSDLIKALSNDLKIPTQQVSSVLKTILDTITNTLVNGDSIELRGFGSFSVRQYKAYEGRNPKTGKVILVKAKKLPFFKVGKNLREQVNVASKK